jgi:hypothetical protein
MTSLTEARILDSFCTQKTNSFDWRSCKFTAYFVYCKVEFGLIWLFLPEGETWFLFSSPYSSAESLINFFVTKFSFLTLFPSFWNYFLTKFFFFFFSSSFKGVYMTSLSKARQRYWSSALWSKSTTLSQSTVDIFIMNY